MNVWKTINSTASKVALSALVAATLVACGGGSGTPTVSVLSGPVTVGISPANSALATAVLAGNSLTFTTGIPALGTTAATTLAFSAPATGSTAVPFTMTSGGVTSVGNLTFGSCIFTTTEYPKGTVLNPALAQTIPTDQCQMTVDTPNAKADGTTATRNVSFTLNGVGHINGIPAPVTVAADGTITIARGGFTFTMGKGTVVQITGAGN